MSRLGRLWTIVEPDELGQISVWVLDPTNKFFSSTYSRKLPNKARAVTYHAGSNKVILGLDDGILQSFELTSSGDLKEVGSAEIHHSAVIGFSGLEQGGSKLLSAAADGSIRLTDGRVFRFLLMQPSVSLPLSLMSLSFLEALLSSRDCMWIAVSSLPSTSAAAAVAAVAAVVAAVAAVAAVESFSVLSGGRLGKRLGSHLLSCCIYEEETKRAFLGTTAGVLLVYRLSAKKPDFESEFLLSPNEAIRCMQADSLGLFVGHGPSISVLQQQRSRLERGALLQIRDNLEDVHSLALDKPHRRLFAGYRTFIAWWSIDRGECLVAWTAHSGGLYSVLRLYQYLQQLLLLPVHQLLCQETGDTLISGGDSGTIKLWRLPPASALTSWGVQTPQQQFDGDECCMRPVEEDAASPYPDVLPDLQQQQQQQQQQREGFAASAAHDDRGSEAFGRGRHPVLLRRYSSDSDEDVPFQQQQQQQQQHEQQQQEEEPPLLLQQAEDSSDEELDDLRRAVLVHLSIEATTAAATAAAVAKANDRVFPCCWRRLPAATATAAAALALAASAATAASAAAIAAAAAIEVAAAMAAGAAIPSTAAIRAAAAIAVAAVGVDG
ncbi:hypothetical protein Emed_004220 [Eimeria media]